MADDSKALKRNTLVGVISIVVSVAAILLTIAQLVL